MNRPYTRAPHAGAATPVHHPAPNAALLIDFDNVTMGIRSDLSRELKALLNSDIIRGKVAVQRAYADWRRYPQYIVPLSEASIDLIFAPAVAPSKKNATDIRLAIDALELVFTRPEIGTFILLSGDSDFSSLVLKLKEYGKYVIGVGIRESSSDLLIQNCDEYYSYTALTGLNRETDQERVRMDPWLLVERALDRMVERDDVMRSDRLKQVMLEIDPTFGEKEYGYSRFSKFLTDAASRGLVKLRKLQNGQYEVYPPDRARLQAAGAEAGAPEFAETARRGAPRERKARPVSEDPLQDAYALLRRAVEDLSRGGAEAARDSDVKRRMLELDSHFDEAELGFSKFSRFLRQAHDAEVVDLRKTDSGNYEVASRRVVVEPAPVEAAAPVAKAEVEAAEPPEPAPAEPEERAVFAAPVGGRAPSVEPAGGELESVAARALRFRRGTRGRLHRPAGPPPILAGQAVGDAVEEAVSEETRAIRLRRRGAREAAAAVPGGDEAIALKEASVPADEADGTMPAAGQGDDLAHLGLPTDPDAIVRYLSSRYRGVGRKTAEMLVKRFGTDIFRVLHRESERIREVLPVGRVESVLAGWQADYERRTARASAPQAGSGGATLEPGEGELSARRRRPGRRGRRPRGGPLDAS